MRKTLEVKHARMRIWLVPTIAAVASCLIGVPSPALAQRLPTLESLLREEGQVQRKALPDAAEDRLAVPADDDLAAARELIKQAYEEDYADTAGGPQRLIDKLLATAGQVDDSTRRYALLVEAERLAIDAGSIDDAIEASSQRSESYEIDPAACRLDTLVALSRSDARNDAALCRVLIDLVDQSLSSDRIDVAEKAVVEAIAAAKRSERRERKTATDERKRTGRQAPDAGDDTGLLALAVDKQKELKDHRRWSQAYDEAVETLRTLPDDPAANVTVGRYRCFVKGEWEEGLAALRLGDSEKLRAVAADEAELRRSEQRTTERVMAVANAWWKVSEGSGMQPRESRAIKRHAAALYEEAQPTVEDPVDQALIRKRLAAVGEPGKAAKQPVASTPTRSTPGRRNGALKIPASSILPAPMKLSEELIPLLPTEAEVQVIQNHVNMPDSRISEARRGFLRRVEQNFKPEKWSEVDAAYLMSLCEKVYLVVNGRGSDFEKSRLAVSYVLGSRNEKEFITRSQSLPAQVLKEFYFASQMDESRIKAWLMGLGPEYASARRKLQAIEYISRQGAATEGMLKYAQALRNATGDAEQ